MKKGIKILQVTGSFPPMSCGVGDNTFELVRHLAERGHEIDVLTSSGAITDSPHPNVRIHPIMNGWSCFYGGRLIRAIREIQPNIIHLQYPTKGYGKGFAPSNLGMQQKGANLRIPFIVTLHEFAHAHPLRKVAILPLLTDATAIIFPSIQERDSLYSKFDMLKPIPTRVIPIGAVLPSNFSDIKSRIENQHDELTKKWQIPKDGIIVNYGFLQNHKGFEVLIAAFKKVLESSYNCELWHIGSFDPEKRSYDRFIETISNRGILNGKVIFKGYLPLDDACEIFGLARCGVFPFTDGFSDRRSSMITFAYFDAPLVTTISPYVEINHRIKDFAILVEPSDDDALAAQIEKLIANKAHYEIQKSRAAGFKSLYDWNTIAEKTERVYLEFINENEVKIQPEWNKQK